MNLDRIHKRIAKNARPVRIPKPGVNIPLVQRPSGLIVPADYAEPEEPAEPEEQETDADPLRDV